MDKRMWSQMSRILRDKNLALVTQGWNREVTLSQNSLLQLTGGSRNSHSGTVKVWFQNYQRQYCIQTHQFPVGMFRENCIIYGRWTTNEQKSHINILELITILYAMKAFKDLHNQMILIRTDNTTSVAYINHQGGTVLKELSHIVEELWVLCLHQNV